MIFEEIFILSSFLCLISGGVLHSFFKKESRTEILLFSASLLLMIFPIFSNSDKIFDLKIIYSIIVLAQFTNLLLMKKSFLNIYNQSLLWLLCLFSFNQPLFYDFILSGSSIILLMIIFNQGVHKENENIKSCINLSFLILFSLIFALFLKLIFVFNSSFYANINPKFYGFTYVILLLFLFFIIFIFPLIYLNDLFKKFKFDFKIIISLSLFYYAFLFKFIWIAQEVFILLSTHAQKYMENIGRMMFGLGLLIWIGHFFSSKQKLEKALISACFFNFSISFLIIFLDKNQEIVDKFKWLLLSIFIPLILWSFLNNSNKSDILRHRLYFLILFSFFGIPLGLTFLSKLFFALDFYKQDFFYEYIFYLGLSQLVLFRISYNFFSHNFNCSKEEKEHLLS